jgi:hypothetical protein
MSRRHEQKHLLHHWSDCRYRDRPQTPRAVLRIGVANGWPEARALADAHRGDGKRFVARAEEKLTAFLELEAAVAATANVEEITWQTPEPWAS